MSATQDLERRIADYYAAEASPRAPAWVLERLLASVEATPQRRTVFGRSPRVRIMPPTLARLGVAAVAVAAIGLVGLAIVRQPAVGPTAPASESLSPSPTPRPSPSAGYSRFDSTINGISIDYPSGWQRRAATRPWGGKIAFDAPDVDVIFDPTFRDDLYLAVVSERLGSKSPRDWVRDHTDSPSLGVCYSGGAGGIGQGFQGNPAWFQTCHDPRTDGQDGHIVIFATPTRGYIIYLHVADERRLDATHNGLCCPVDGTGLLETVELRPDEALDTVNLSESP